MSGEVVSRDENGPFFCSVGCGALAERRQQSRKKEAA
jgi:hypothetical protein